MKAEEITREELLKKNLVMTVGQLKAFLNEHNLPDHAPVVVERVEDVYYEKYGWVVYKRQQDGRDVEYTRAFCCPRYFDEGEILFIDMHY